MNTSRFGVASLASGIALACVVLGAIGNAREIQLRAKEGHEPPNPPIFKDPPSSWSSLCLGELDGIRVRLVGNRLEGITLHDSDRHTRYTFSIVGSECTVDAVYWQSRWSQEGIALLQTGEVLGRVNVVGKVAEYKGRRQINVYSMKVNAE